MAPLGQIQSDIFGQKCHRNDQILKIEHNFSTILELYWIFLS